MRGHKPTLFVVGVLWAFSFLPAPAQTSVLHLTKSDTVYSLEKNLFYLPPESVKNDSLDYGITSENFAPLTEFQPAFEHGEYHWLKVELFNEVPDRYEWVIRFSLVPTEIEYLALVGHWEPQRGKTGFFLPPDERTFKPALKGNFAKIILPAGEVTTVFFKIKSDRAGMGPEFDMELSSTDFFYKNLKTAKQNNGLYMGFILLIFIYNLFLFFLAKDRAYVYYSAYLFTLTLFTIYNTGDLADWLVEPFFPDHPQRFAYFKLVTYFIIISYLAFLRYFLDLARTFPKWDSAFRWLSWATPVAMLVDFLIMSATNFNYATADKLTVGFTLIFLVLIFAFLFPLSKSDDRQKHFIIWGVAAMGIGALFTIVNRFHGVDFSTLPFRIGTVVEVIIFSLGLAYRQREAERQKQEARFELERAKIFQEQKDKEAARLSELNEAKNKFYTDIAHEFRTPLTVILGMGEELAVGSRQLAVGEEEKDKFQKGLTLIRRNGEQLLRQINQLLDLAKLDSKALKINEIQADIFPFLAYLTESFYSMAEEKNVRLTFYPEGKNLIMDFDENKIQHIVYNLLSNAVKFTPKKGKVILHARQVERGGQPFLQLKVSDTGIGISEKELPHIFKRYYQVEGKKQGGSGIGLSLTRDLTELLGGSISVKSEAGKGAEFTVFLPKKNSAPMGGSAVRRFDSSAVRQSGEGDRRTGEQWTAEPPTGEGDRRTGELPPPSLLIIEDNRDVATFIGQVLEKDYHLLFAEDGQAGIEMAVETVPDLIISDVMMPEKNGFEVCHFLKNDERTSHIPIVLLTAKATEPDKLTGLKAGADAYLLKPFNREELLIRLEKLHGLRTALRTKYATNLSTGILEKKETAAPSIEDVFLKKLTEAVVEKLDAPHFGVGELCQAASMSNTQLNRKLKALTGDTPSRFIRKVRLQQAKLFLENSDLNVSEVAYRVGFNDPNYFTRLFSEEYGVPPSKVR